MGPSWIADGWLLDAAGDLPSAAHLGEGVDPIHLMTKVPLHGFNLGTYVTGVAGRTFCLRALVTLEVFDARLFVAVVLDEQQECMLSLRLRGATGRAAGQTDRHQANQRQAKL